MAMCLAFAPAAGATEKLEDMPAITRAVNTALESAKTGSVTQWENPATGSSGTITVERTYLQPDRTPCREYVRETDGAPPLITRGTGCRVDLLRWDLTETASEPAGPPNPIVPASTAEEPTPATPTPLAALPEPEEEAETPPVITGRIPTRSY